MFHVMAIICCNARGMYVQCLIVIIMEFNIWLVSFSCFGCIPTKPKPSNIVILINRDYSFFMHYYDVPLAVMVSFVIQILQIIY